jgi:hypothetical protein
VDFRPFIFDFSSNGAARRFMIITGAVELMTSVATRWEPVDNYHRGSRQRRSGLAPAR